MQPIRLTRRGRWLALILALSVFMGVLLTAAALGADSRCRWIRQHYSSSYKIQAYC